jgi:myo-inositol-1(or 4)-monophosphatase
MSYPKTFWSQVVEFSQSLTHEVGQTLLADFGQVHTEEKQDGSLVTRCDRWADQTLCQRLAAQFPDHGLLSEETSHIFPGQDWCWVIDPLDGTTNFARGVPLWGISLGLLYQGTPVFGFVQIPVLNQGFYGFWPGTSGLDLPSGAFCNGQPIQTNQAELTPSHLFSFCTRSIKALQQPPAKNFPLPCKVRMLGVATYNLLAVANGMVMGGVEATPKVWDIAATWAIVQAAGAQWLFLSANPFPLQPSQNYQEPAYPTLVLAQPNLKPIFYPLVQNLVEQNSAQI